MGIRHATALKVPAKDVPIIIINFENLFTLRPMIDTLHDSFGYRNIIVLDNASTYPPLLEYYGSEACLSKCKVVRLDKNYGHTALWKCNALNHVFSDWYVLTDPDLELEHLPPTFVEDLIALHLRLRFASNMKIGCALRVDDLPDHYKYKKDVLEWETVSHNFWKNPLPESRDIPIYKADLDTTLSVYPPGWSRYSRLAYRVAGPFTIRHLPWYFDLDNLPANEVYYRQKKLANSGYWSAKG